MDEPRHFDISKWIALTLVAGFTFLSVPLCIADANYGQFGPYNYYNPPKGALQLVESAHMRTVIAGDRHRGNWCAYYGNLDYTLRAFPNHPEALVLMAEYLDVRSPCSNNNARSSSKGKSPLELAAAIEAGAWHERTADYYFKKGIRYKPKDAPNSVVNYPETHVLYGKYLYTHKRSEDALTQFKDAIKLEPRSAEAHYYLGLILFEKNDTEAAKRHIQTGYKISQPPVELKQKLINIGQWREK
ncbi:MAG TPA: tetratricopeptide repeat protein [Burkholderiales bacterium]